MTYFELYKLIQSRYGAAPSNSYVSSLLQSKPDRAIQKVGEEAVEVVIAAKNTSRKLLIAEITDLIFHLTVVMVKKNLTWEEIETELDKRSQNSYDPSS
ncbi:MAG TPA: phosphoribosyl-ATP diphosphatase [Patescibacteria group bacterium]|nr:phosphoribosyl-ATP diphosphatase [Patescibacteria group bacterium]